MADNRDAAEEREDPKGADDFIRMAASAPPKSDLRRALLMSALLMEDPDFLTNVAGGPPRGRGRPKQKKPEVEEANQKALHVMWNHYWLTGESRARRLACVAADTGKIPFGYSDYNSVVDRLAKFWRDIMKDGLPSRDPPAKDWVDMERDHWSHRGPGAGNTEDLIRTIQFRLKERDLL